MKIIKKYNWNRRDFSYDAQCENCGHITKNQSGYDDDNYYQNVIPGCKCKKCGESTKSLGTTIEPSDLKYHPNQSV